MRLRHASLAAVAVASLVALGACDNDSPQADPSIAPATSAPPDSSAPSTEPGTTAPASEPASSVPGSSAPESTAPSGCEGDPTVETATELVVGLSEADAEAALDACGWIVRVTRLDGEDLPATLDLRPNRVNVEVTGGEVTAVLNIG